MATREKLKYNLNIKNDVCMLKVDTLTYQIIFGYIDTTEEEEVALGVSELMVEVDERLSAVSTKSYFMNTANVTSLSAFEAHVKTLLPSQTEDMNYEWLDAYEEINASDNTVSYMGNKTGEYFSEELQISSTPNWTVNHVLRDGEGNFICSEFEDIVNEMVANGRTEYFEADLELEEKKSRAKFISHFEHQIYVDMLNGIDVSARRARLSELFADEPLTSEELAILDTL